MSGLYNSLETVYEEEEVSIQFMSKIKGWELCGQMAQTYYILSNHST